MPARFDLGSKERKMSWILVMGAAVLAVFLVIGVAQEADTDLLEEIRAEIIPAERTETAYGIPLSLRSLPQFIEWWTTVVPLIEEDPRYFDALSALVAPCCDDNTAFLCCCEKGGQSCNIIRSGKGLAAHLIYDLDLETDQIRASVSEWFRFARPDYYLAAELEARGVSPIPYGLTTEGSCYRGMCDVPISQGGCGGMLELIEPAIEPAEG
jgi:hypothetical protein